MTEQPFAIDAGHSPSSLIRVMNPILCRLLGTPFAGPLGKQFMVLNFKGRKSGRQFSLPVSAHRIDNELYALSGLPWNQNFRGGAAAEVTYAGKTTTMHGELLRDRATVADLFHRCAESYGVKRAQRMIGLKFRDQRIPSLEEFAEAVDRLKLAAIRLTPAK